MAHAADVSPPIRESQNSTAIPTGNLGELSRPVSDLLSSLLLTLLKYQESKDEAQPVESGPYPIQSKAGRES